MARKKPPNGYHFIISDIYNLFFNISNPRVIALYLVTVFSLILCAIFRNHAKCWMIFLSFFIPLILMYHKFKESSNILLPAGRKNRFWSIIIISAIIGIYIVSYTFFLIIFSDLAAFYFPQYIIPGKSYLTISSNAESFCLSLFFTGFSLFLAILFSRINYWKLLPVFIFIPYLGCVISVFISFNSWEALIVWGAFIVTAWKYFRDGDLVMQRKI